MYKKITFIDENVAFSSSPQQGDLKELSKMFDDVIILAQKDELPYNIDLWKKYDVNTLYEPIKDYRSPSLLKMHYLSSYIAKESLSNKKVLVHCKGGLGRSGTVVAGYLIVTRGLSWIEALKNIRHKKPGAIESLEQLSTLRAYSLLVSSLTIKELDIITKLLFKYTTNCEGWNEKHASKVAQLSLLLLDEISQKLNIRFNINRAVRILTLASFFHDIGRCINAFLDSHELVGAKWIEKSDFFKNIFSENERKKIICLIKNHSRKKDPRKDFNCKKDFLTIFLTGILKITDGLDYFLDQRVLDLNIDIHANAIIIEIYCENNCSFLKKIVKEKAEVLEDAIKKKLLFIFNNWLW